MHMFLCFVSTLCTERQVYMFLPFRILCTENQVHTFLHFVSTLCTESKSAYVLTILVHSALKGKGIRKFLHSQYTLHWKSSTHILTLLGHRSVLVKYTLSGIVCTEYTVSKVHTVFPSQFTLHCKQSTHVFYLVSKLTLWTVKHIFVPSQYTVTVSKAANTMNCQ